MFNLYEIILLLPDKCYEMTYFLIPGMEAHFLPWAQIQSQMSCLEKGWFPSLVPSYPSGSPVLDSQWGAHWVLSTGHWSWWVSPEWTSGWLEQEWLSGGSLMKRLSYGELGKGKIKWILRRMGGSCRTVGLPGPAEIQHTQVIKKECRRGTCTPHQQFSESLTTLR